MTLDGRQRSIGHLWPVSCAGLHLRSSGPQTLIAQYLHCHVHILHMVYVLVLRPGAAAAAQGRWVAVCGCFDNLLGRSAGLEYLLLRKVSCKEGWGMVERFKYSEASFCQDWHLLFARKSVS